MSCCRPGSGMNGALVVALVFFVRSFSGHEKKFFFSYEIEGNIMVQALLQSSHFGAVCLSVSVVLCRAVEAVAPNSTAIIILFSLSFFLYSFT